MKIRPFTILLPVLVLAFIAFLSTTTSAQTIIVNPPTLPDGEVGVLYDQTISATGGTEPYTFDVTSGSLPTGLTLNSTTGALTGIPTVEAAFNFDITATDFDGRSGSRSYTVNIVDNTITVDPPTLPDGTVGVSYDQIISASGGTAPYTFNVTNGALPDGLILDPDSGQLSGTPTVEGEFIFTITATDDNAFTGSRDYTVNIVEIIITVDPPTLPDGTVGVSYDQTISASGGTPPYTFNVTNGALPDGLALDPVTGQLSGTPTVEGEFTFTITATDDTAFTGSRDYAVNICAVIALNPPALIDGELGVVYDQTVTASGGTGPYTYSVTGGTLPDGLVLNSNTGQIAGTPTVEGTFGFDITAADVNGCPGTQGYTITIGPTCLFCDEFDDSTVSNEWTYIKSITAWSEDGAALIGSPSKKKTQAHAIPVFAGCTNCSASTVLRSSGGSFNRVWFLFHVQDKDNLVELLMKEESNVWVLKQRINKSIVAKQKFKAVIDPNTDYTVSIRYDGTNFIVAIDGVDQITLVPAGPVPGGSVGFKVKATNVRIERIEVN